MCYKQGDVAEREGEPTMLICYLFYPWKHEIRARKNPLINLQEMVLAGEIQSQNDMH